MCLRLESRTEVFVKYKSTIRKLSIYNFDLDYHLILTENVLAFDIN